MSPVARQRRFGTRHASVGSGSFQRMRRCGCFGRRKFSSQAVAKPRLTQLTLLTGMQHLLTARRADASSASIRDEGGRGFKSLRHRRQRPRWASRADFFSSPALLNSLPGIKEFKELGRLPTTVCTCCTSLSATDPLSACPPRNSRIYFLPRTGRGCGSF
jgi:hypothetical protein